MKFFSNENFQTNFNFFQIKLLSRKYQTDLLKEIHQNSFKEIYSKGSKLTIQIEIYAKNVSIPKRLIASFIYADAI